MSLVGFGIKELSIVDRNLELSPVISNRKIDEFILTQNGESWKGEEITIKQYFQREDELNSCEICVRDLTTLKGNWRFILRDLNIKKNSEVRNNDDDELFNIVCSLDLIIRDGKRISIPNSEEVDVINVKSGAIGSVWTLKNHRKKGYAKTMVDLLNKWCKKFLNYESKETNYSFGTLYSEIGDYYSRSGYIGRKMSFIEIRFLNVKKVESTFKSELIDKGKFRILCEKSNTLITNKLIEKISSENNPSKVYLLNDYNHYFIDWLHARGNYYNKVLNNNQPLKFGLKLINQENIDLGYIVWNYDFIDHHIDVLKIESFVKYDDINDETNFEEEIIKNLLKELTKYLSSLKLKDFRLIKIWQASIDYKILNKSSFQIWLTNNLNSRLNVENYVLPAITSFNENDQKLIENGELSWECNEKWAWF